MNLSQPHKNYYKNNSVFEIDGYEIYFTRFADSIINDHFIEAVQDLKNVLSEFYIAEQQIIEGGGGLSSITQKLRDKLYEYNWKKIIIDSEQRVRSKLMKSESHEVDHFKEFEQGNIGLEIEWNNKDPFYDRDLENFRKLHQLDEIALGMIITRGASLQDELLEVCHRFLIDLYPFDLEELRKHISLSVKDQAIIKKLLTEENHDIALDRIAKKIYTSKYGQTTTHMDKLLLRVDRGVGNPCPLVIIGIGKERLVRSNSK